MTSGIRVAQARQADFESWVALRARLWTTVDVSSLRTEASRMVDDDRAAVFLAWSGNRVVGFAEVTCRDFAEGCSTRPVGYLEGWWTDDAHRRKGIGRLLMRACEDWARARGCKEMASDAEVGNVISIAAHKALGFDEVERVVLFKKPLG